ncbi:MAG: hypothetical protein JXA33_03305 [Anaerolineae bacterium]|nr:hypothetical protein [Anaerolineae bacterium]
MYFKTYLVWYLTWVFVGLVVLGMPLCVLAAEPASVTFITSPPDPLAEFATLSNDRVFSPPSVAAPQLVSPTSPISLPDPVWRIGIITDGLYSLEYASLIKAGMPITRVSIDALHLLWRGQEVALDIQDIASNGVFDPGDTVLFYGQRFHSTEQDEKYTAENVYWLTLDVNSPGLRMASRTVAPTTGASPASGCATTAHTERNLIYWARWSQLPQTDATWFWHIVNTADTVTHTYPITLTAPLSQGAPAQLTIEVVAKNEVSSFNPDHHLRIAFNAVVLAETSWDGMVGHRFSMEVPAALLHDGVNDVQIAYVTEDAGVQVIYFDKATLVYTQSPTVEGESFTCNVLAARAATYEVSGLSAPARLYDISDPIAPIILTDYTTTPFVFHDAAPAGTIYLAEPPRPVTPTSYHVVSELLMPTTGADQIIVAPRDFLPVFAPLVTYRQMQGLRVQAVAVEDVYALFNGGIVHPEAIRSFVAYAYTHWPGAPARSLFLVGDGHFNMHNHNPTTYGEFTPVHIPPYLEFADPDQGEVPVDSRYGDVDGDGFPDLEVGRLPAITVDDVIAYIDKVLMYEAQPHADWQLHILHFADDGQTSYEGYDDDLDTLAQDLIPDAFTVDTVYIRDYCNEAGRPNTTACPAATVALTTAWSNGAGLLTYSGHGAIFRWAHEPLVLNTDLTTLNNINRWPFLISLDCWDGYWMFPPQYPSLPRNDMRAIGEWTTTVLTRAGAIAAFGPAGLGYRTYEVSLARAIYRQIFERGEFRLGPLTQAGRASIAPHYLARTYTLLGDPELSLPWWDALTLVSTWPSATLPVGATFDLRTSVTAQGHARFGAYSSGATFPVTPTWTADVGTVDSFGRYIAPPVPTVAHITGHLGPVSASIALTIVAGSPVSLSVTPSPLVLLSGDMITLTATPLDAYGNPLDATSISWASNLGNIDARGQFTASSMPLLNDAVVTGWITATATVSGSTMTLLAYVPVFVLDSLPTAVNIMPDSLSLTVGNTVLLTATLINDVNEPISIPVETAWDSTVGFITSQGRYTAPNYPSTGRITTTLTYPLRTGFETLSSNIPVTIVTGQPVAVRIVPKSPLRLRTGDSVQLLAFPIDQLGNTVVSTTTVMWDSNIGTINAGGLFSAPLHPALGQITATVALSQGTVTFHLPPASVEAIVQAYIYLPLVMKTA